MLKKIAGFKDKNSLAPITLDNIQRAMYEIGFDKAFVGEIIKPLAIRVNNNSERKFQEWFYELHYRLPDEFKDDEFAIKLYENHASFIEKEVIKLEKETELPWEKQAEDLGHLDEKASKVQLVIRHRLSDIALDLLN
ncbi:hypothetical protein [Ornithinibacillus californiensis]|uniref:hypothetical protein n=1 Tax=Ornithinibacillus californiensis TaxID=161536 RepID=UPI00064D7E83|nr:hypothetical protein [Ornithinibacillus californiensis]